MNRNYDSDSQDYDIGLIELKKPLNFTDQVQPISLIDENDKILDGTKCLVTGWGDTNQRVANFNKGKLRAVEVSIVNQRTCNKNYREYGGVTPRMLCAGKSQKDACQGDSGGPLACHLPSQNGNLTLVGVVSWGVDCGKPNLPGVYTRLTSVRQWIRNQTGI